MSVTLSIVSDLDDEAVQELTTDLCQTINSETSITAEPAKGPSGPGHKGDMGTIGTILLTLVGSGGVVVPLIGVLKSYFDRGRPFEVELERKDGAKFKIKTENLGSDQIESTMKLAKDFLGNT